MQVQILLSAPLPAMTVYSTVMRLSLLFVHWYERDCEMEQKLSAPTSKVNYNFIDIMKFVMSICVVIIHRPIFANEIANAVSRLSICWISVPFFFVCSGFFFGKSMAANSSPKSFFKSLKRVFFLYLIWTLIYFPMIYFLRYSGSIPVADFKHIFGFALVFLRDFFFDKSFIHFWYLSALIWTMPIVYLLTKKIKPGVLAVISFFICIIFDTATAAAEKYQSIESVINYIPPVFQNVLTYALPSFLIGYCISQNEQKYKTIKTLPCIALALLVAADISCLLIDGKNGTIFNFTHKLYVIAAAALIFRLTFGIKIKNTKRCIELRKYSTVIYCCHLILRTVWIKDFFAFLGLNFGSFEPFAIFAVTCIYSFAISAIIINLAKIPKLKFLRYLY